MVYIYTQLLYTIGGRSGWSTPTPSLPGYHARVLEVLCPSGRAWRVGRRVYGLGLRKVWLEFHSPSLPRYAGRNKRNWNIKTLLIHQNLAYVCIYITIPPGGVRAKDPWETRQRLCGGKQAADMNCGAVQAGVGAQVRVVHPGESILELPRPPLCPSL